MSFTGDIEQPDIWNEFNYYSDETGTDGKLSDSLSSPTGNRWQFKELRMHFSTAFASVEDLVIRVSSPRGSYHNFLILSQAMNGSQDLLVQYSSPVWLLSNESIVVEQSMASGANLFGLQITGWAAQG